MFVGFKKLTEDAILPTRAHRGDSGFDLYANKDIIIEPGDTLIVGTGIAVDLPEGHEAQIRPRSGLTAKTKLRVQLGTIDNGYKGELGVIVDNTRTPSLDYGISIVNLVDGNTYGWKNSVKSGTYLIRKGDRIAQLVIQRLPSVNSYEIEGELEETNRGSGGFGSTGV